MTTPEPPPYLDDPDAPASEEEARAAEALRLALEGDGLGGNGAQVARGGADNAHDAAELARAVALAHAPRALPREEHQAILDQALAHMPAAPTAPAAPVVPLRRAPTKLRARVAIAIAAALPLALAAAATLFLGRVGQEPAEFARAAVARPVLHARSTQPLFREPFRAQGGESARVDRIAMARASDLRDNRFARWGVP